MALVLGFKSSDNLGSAYGIAVTGTMAIDGMLAFIYMVGVVRWNPVLSAVLFGFFLTVDISFFVGQCVEDRAGRLVPAAGRGARLCRDVVVDQRPAAFSSRSADAHRCRSTSSSRT